VFLVRVNAAVVVLFCLGCGCGPTSPKVEAPRELAYSDPSPTYRLGAAITPNTPTSAGGPVESYAVEPALVAGLSLDTATGVVSGTPAAVAAAKQFTVTATNSAGSVTATLQIAVNGAPSLSYAGATGTSGTFGVAMSVAPTTLAGNGAPVSGCAVKASTPALPAGLSVDATTCVISGTPAAASAAALYTLEATNAVGTSAPATVTLTVNAGPPQLSYAGATGTTGAVGAAMAVTPTTLAANGAAVSACEVRAGTPALPAGLSVNPSTCVIAGTPTASAAATVYTLVATNSAGASADAPVTLTVAVGAPVLSYAGATGTTGLAGSPMSVSPTSLVLNGGALSGCGVKGGTAALPAGLAVDPATCVISGTPASSAALATYTVVATNAGGPSADATVALTVTATPPTLSFAGAANTAGVAGMAMSVAPTTLLANGAAVFACAVTGTPTKPAWMSVDATTCVISGTPPAPFAATVFTLSATNSAGASTGAPVTLSAAAAPAVPTLSYVASTGTILFVGTPMSVSPSTLQSNGLPIIACGVTGTPAAPAWLSVNASTCALSGTPTASFGPTTFFIVATNSLGDSAAAGVTLQAAGAPSLSYAGATGTTGLVNSPLNVAPTSLTVNGAVITACGIKPATTPLPSTLTVSPTTCVISGTPTAVLTSTLFTLVATNVAGTSADATVTLRVDAAAPTLSYAGATGTSGIAGVAMGVSPTSLVANGSAVTDCQATPALPAGLVLGPTNCQISGTPSAASPDAVYTVRATNGAGQSLGATVHLVVRARASVTISDAPTYDFGAWSTTAVSEHLFMLANSGDLPATALASSGALGATYAFKGGTYPGQGGTCGDTLAGGASCGVVVTFAPTSAATFPGSLAFGYQDGVSGRTVSCALTGTGTTQASLVVTDFPPNYYTDYAFPPDGPTFDFGAHALGTPTEHAFVVTNHGGTAATVTGGSALAAPYAYQGATFPGVGGDCGLAALAPGGSCTVIVTFTPTATAAASATLTVSYSGGASPTVSRPLTGSGTSGALLSLYDFRGPSGGLNFGPAWDFATLGVGSFAEKDFLVVNLGAATATALAAGSLPAGFTFPGGFPGAAPTAFSPDAQANYCQSSLAASAACAVRVRFAPTAVAAYSGAVTVAYAVGQTATRNVKGSGTDRALLSITDLENRGGVVFSYGLRPVASHTPAAFLVENLGAATASTLTAVSLPAGFGYTGGSYPGGTGTYTDPSGTTSSYCGGVLAAGSRCVVRVDFQPSSSALFAANIDLTYDDLGGAGATRTARRSVEGTGTTLAIVSMSDCLNCGGGGGGSGTPAHDFGFVAAGQAVDQFFLLSNTGSQGATLASASLTGAAFAFPGGFPGGTPGAPVNLWGTTYPYCPGTSGTLAANSSCLVRVSYAASGTAPQSGGLTVTLTGATVPSVAYNLLGTPTALGIVSISSCTNCGGGGGPGVPAYDFGVVAAGSSTTQLFFLHNSGAGAALLTDAGLSGAGFSYAGGYPGGTPGSTFDFFGTPYTFCPASGAALAGGATCILKVTYSASGAALQAGGFTVNLTGATTPSVGYTLTGTPTNLAIVSLTECAGCGTGPGAPTHDFGPVASPSTATTFFYLSNAGASPAVLATAGFTGAAFGFTAGAFPGGTPGSPVAVGPGTFNYCPALGGLLPAGQTCVLQVTYSASGSSPQSGGLSLGLTGATAPNVSYGLTGTPTSLAIVQLTECPSCGGGGGPGTPVHDFGAVASPSVNDLYLFVVNTGFGSATITPSPLTGPGYAYGGAGTYPGGTPGSALSLYGQSFNFCPAAGQPVAGGSQCVVKVTYTASGTAPQAGGLSLAVTGATVSSLAYDFTASPTTAAIVRITDCPTCGASMSPFNFGTAGTALDAVFIITNAGVSGATVNTTGALAAPFGFSTGGYPGGTGTSTAFGAPIPFCTTTLAPTSSCVVSVRYSAAATANGALTLGLTGATTATASRPLTGQATARAYLTVSEDPGLFGCTDGNCGPAVFGPVAAGSTVFRTLVVSNRGALATTALFGAPLGSGYGYGQSGVQAFPGGSGTTLFNGTVFPFCSGVLAPGAQCALQVNFHPAAAATSYPGAVSLTYSDAGGAVLPNATRNLLGASL
jgi:hypothetical protein